MNVPIFAVLGTESGPSHVQGKHSATVGHPSPTIVNFKLVSEAKTEESTPFNLKKDESKPFNLNAGSSGIWNEKWVREDRWSSGHT